MTRPRCSSLAPSHPIFRQPLVFARVQLRLLGLLTGPTTLDPPYTTSSISAAMLVAIQGSPLPLHFTWCGAEFFECVEDAAELHLPRAKLVRFRDSDGQRGDQATLLVPKSTPKDPGISARSALTSSSTPCNPTLCLLGGQFLQRRGGIRGIIRVRTCPWCSTRCFSTPP